MAGGDWTGQRNKRLNLLHICYGHTQARYARRRKVQFAYRSAAAPCATDGDATTRTSDELASWRSAVDGDAGTRGGSVVLCAGVVSCVPTTCRLCGTTTRQRC